MKHFRDLLNENRKVMGTILQFPCPEIVEILKEAGSDHTAGVSPPRGNL